MKRLAGWLWQVLFTHVACRREPDFIIGGRDNPYVLRWWLLGGMPDPARPGKLMSRNFLGVRPYLHCFMRSDDDRAHHDHPAASISLCLSGGVSEETILAGGILHRRAIGAGSIRFRSAKFAHRLEVEPGVYCWTLFIFCPGQRNWGFHCQQQGWVPWQKFTNPADSGMVGPGCEQ